MKYSWGAVEGCLLSADKRADDLLDRLLLEIKALVLLEGSDAGLRARLRGRLVDTHDESLKRFVAALQTRKPRETGRLLVVALGELILASLLVLVGALVLLPTVAGITTPAGLLQYFVEKVTGAVGGSPLSPYLPLLEFVVGALLMLSAFYTLRQAAVNLKEAGLAIEPGEE
jgi:hypothetical protein